MKKISPPKNRTAYGGSSKGWDFITAQEGNSDDGRYTWIGFGGLVHLYVEGHILNKLTKKKCLSLLTKEQLIQVIEAAQIYGRSQFKAELKKLIL